jgi:hypothetical protein
LPTIIKKSIVKQRKYTITMPFKKRKDDLVFAVGENSKHEHKKKRMGVQQGLLQSHFNLLWCDLYGMMNTLSVSIPSRIRKKREIVLVPHQHPYGNMASSPAGLRIGERSSSGRR